MVCDNMHFNFPTLYNNKKSSIAKMLQQLIYIIDDIYMLLSMSNKTKRIKDKDDYEESSFKDIVKDMEDTKNRALELVPKIRKEQVPTAGETSNEILYGGDDEDDDDKL
jgi:hypothetical protein